MRTRNLIGRRVLMMTSLVATAGLALPSAQAFDSASASAPKSSIVAQTDACDGAAPSSGDHQESRRAVSGSEFAQSSRHTDDRIIVVGIGTQSTTTTAETSRVSFDGVDGRDVKVTIKNETTGDFDVVVADRIIVVGVSPESCSADQDRVVADRIIVVGGPTPGTTLELDGRTVAIDGKVAAQQD